MLLARVFQPEKVEPVWVKPFVVRAVVVLALWEAVAPPSEVLPRKVTVWIGGGIRVHWAYKVRSAAKL